MKYKTLTAVFLFGAITLSASIHAQQIVPDPVSILVSSSAPYPGETVFVEGATPTLDRNSSFFEWTVAGKQRSDLSGVGKFSFSLRAGDIGSVTEISLRVLRSGGIVMGNDSMLLRVADLSLPWIAQTHIPPWYKGKALPVQNSVVRVIAIPRIVIGGRAIPPENLVYRWDFDDQERVLAGIGRSEFEFRMSDLPGRTHRILVRVEDVNKQILKEKELFLVAEVQPRVSIYSVTPLGGIETRSSSGFFASAKRGFLDFLAEPFFFPIASLPSITYQWTVAGEDVSSASLQTPNVLTINTGENPETLIPISVRANVGDPLIPGALKTIDLFFR